MKVILLEDVNKLGEKGELVNVSDGYARNYLLRKDLAMEATKENMNVYKTRKNAMEKKKEREIEKANDKKEKIENGEITLSAKSGDTGKLFGAITSKDISVGIEKELGIKIDKKKIVLDEPIKMVGEYEVEVKLYANISAMLKVMVKGE